jgi:uncharacterized protein
MQNRLFSCLPPLFLAAAFFTYPCLSPAEAAENTSQGAGPGFDCAKATTKPERLICSNSDLSVADLKLNQLFKKVFNSAEDKETLKKDQLAWMKNRRNVCTDLPCMLEAYRERIAVLEKGASAAAAVTPSNQTQASALARDTKKCPIITFKPVKESELKFDDKGRVLSTGKYSSAGIGDDEAVDYWVKVLKQAVADDHREEIASMVHYPLRVNSDKGKYIKIRDQAAFLKSYNDVFTPKVKQAVLSEGDTGFFAKDKGVMLGRGDLWFSLYDGKLLIKAINR